MNMLIAFFFLSITSNGANGAYYQTMGQLRKKLKSHSVYFVNFTCIQNLSRAHLPQLLIVADEIFDMPNNILS